MPSVEDCPAAVRGTDERGSLNASFVSGQCGSRRQDRGVSGAQDRAPSFTKALLLVEGFDVPDITGVCIPRPTKIWNFTCKRSFVARARWPHRRIGDKGERLAAITASASPRLRSSTSWLVTASTSCTRGRGSREAGGRERMLASGETNLVKAEATAEQDLLQSLAKATRKHARKQAPHDPGPALRGPCRWGRRARRMGSRRPEGFSAANGQPDRVSPEERLRHRQCEVQGACRQNHWQAGGAMNSGARHPRAAIAHAAARARRADRAHSPSAKPPKPSTE